ncbi:hypothetical protein LZZ85_09045 [Terrimonas sp. NA20]|uniref:Lipoprotein n=1 Tax=Terrimonas ginsenosidimutans TaxID=2908004 RepID=A0ABS9KQ48_9BACT|nr:hypothetical protein [Terrimonas ginsenosidimutans]MCG2614425.1 hypothetical protein [Terrimonas ginsenosidimutans]
MKKLFCLLLTASVFVACNNEGETDGSGIDSIPVPADSMTNPSSSDPNNRNTSVYDTSARRDTASYERMQQIKTDDSIRR